MAAAAVTLVNEKSSRRGALFGARFGCIGVAMVAMCLLGGMLGYWNIAASDVRCNRRANKSEWKFQIYCWSTR